QSKEHNIKLALATFFSGGNLLIEDIPGVGKTTLAKSFATVLGLGFKRVQFTSDMLPSDIIGVNYFDTKQSEFIFKKGAIFSECMLADEINRATPKTQSALLEAMEEGQVTVEGNSYKLQEDFFVMATQNPIEEGGTFELPISQLDRFMVSMSLGYPTLQAEKKILLEQEDTIQLQSITQAQRKEIKKRVQSIYIDEKIVDYILKITTFTRQSGLFEYGFSTRGAKQLLRLSKAWAMIEGRDFVIDDDIDTLLPYVLSHRVIAKKTDSDIIDAIYQAIH
ncbi:MAG: AAA family ATPase, partial [Campylobacterota bacterium]